MQATPELLKQVDMTRPLNYYTARCPRCETHSTPRWNPSKQHNECLECGRRTQLEDIQQIPTVGQIPRPA